MRKVIISLAAAGAALAAASPAAAQFYPGQQGYGYGYGYNGYNAQRTHEIGLRIERLNRRIQGLGRAGVINARQARSLALESRALGYQLQAVSRNGLDPREQRSVEVRLANLEQRLQYMSANRNGYRNNGYNYGRYDGGYSRDRDDRDDDRDWRGDRHGRDHDRDDD